MIHSHTSSLLQLLGRKKKTTLKYNNVEHAWGEEREIETEIPREKQVHRKLASTAHTAIKFPICTQIVFFFITVQSLCWVCFCVILRRFWLYSSEWAFFRNYPWIVRDFLSVFLSFTIFFQVHCFTRYFYRYVTQLYFRISGVFWTLKCECLCLEIVVE